MKKIKINGFKILPLIGALIPYFWIYTYNVSMTVEQGIRFGSIAAIFSSIALGLCELSMLLRDYFKGIFIEGHYDHSRQHIVFILLTVLSNILLVYWLFNHKGFKHGLNVHLLGENLWRVLYIISFAYWYGYSHLSDERKQLK